MGKFKLELFFVRPEDVSKALLPSTTHSFLQTGLLTLLAPQDQYRANNLRLFAAPQAPLLHLATPSILQQLRLRPLKLQIWAFSMEGLDRT